jgi:hypothetical protein
MKRLSAGAIIWLIFLISGAQAFKLENLPFFSNFHIGFVSGAGAGLNFGANGKFLLGNVKLGAEIEQLITDVNYSASINAVKYGGLVSYNITDLITLNGHYGRLQFKTNKDFAFTDLANNSRLLLANTAYTGTYLAISLDYSFDWFSLTPKYTINTVQDKGSVAEFDINVSRGF